MLGNFKQMQEKLAEMQRQVEESKKRLDSITVKGSAGGGVVSVIMTGNRKVQKITVDSSLLEEKNTELLEETLVTAMNQALDSAEKVYENEMGSAARGMLPNFPGMF